MSAVGHLDLEGPGGVRFGWRGDQTSEMAAGVAPQLCCY